MRSLFVFPFPSESIIICVAFMTCLLFKSDGFLSVVLLLGKFTLPIQLVRLTLQPVLFKLGSTLLFRSVGCELASFNGLLLLA